MKQLGYFETRKGRLYFVPKYRYQAGRLSVLLLSTVMLIVFFIFPLAGLIAAGLYYLHPGFRTESIPKQTSYR